MKGVFVRTISIFGYCLMAAFVTSAMETSVNTTEKSQEYTIERYESERDREALRKILKESAEQILLDSSAKEQAESLKRFEASPNTHVLRVNNKTVGMIDYYIQDISLLTFQFDYYGVINGIGILKQYKRNGYGTNLLKFAIKELEKSHVPTITLDVKANNTKAINFYTRNGFHIEKPINPHSTLRTYNRTVDIDPQYAKKGNWIQQHPKAFFVACATLGALWYSWPR